jgi:hypothetical protein
MDPAIKLISWINSSYGLTIVSNARRSLIVVEKKQRLRAANATVVTFGRIKVVKETVQKCRIVRDNRNFPTAASANLGKAGKTIPANRVGYNAQKSSTLTDRHLTGAAGVSRGSNGLMARFLVNRSLIGSTAHWFSIVLEE